MSHNDSMIEFLKGTLKMLDESNKLVTIRSRRLAVELIKSQQDKIIDQMLGGALAGYVPTDDMQPLISALVHIKRAQQEIQWAINDLDGVPAEEPPI